MAKAVPVSWATSSKIYARSFIIFRAKVDMDTLHLDLALTSLSKHIANTFPKILPVVLYTIGGAVMITVVGNRTSTEDVDVSVVQLVERYGAIYPKIQSELKEIILEVWEELDAIGIDIGKLWMNWNVDLVLPDGTIRSKMKIMTI